MEVLSIKEKIRSKPGAIQPHHLKGYVNFEDVTYRYNGEQPALKNLNFRIEPGQFVGLVGPNGAGKSTVLSLMLRLYDPNKGKIYIDGKKIKEYEVEAFRERFGVILPEPILFQATVAENIAYGKPGAEMSEIEEAAVFANAHDFIQKLPNDYQTVVGETGTTLSTGQRQRIAIARAIIKGFDILLLDEPLARLDAISIEHVKSVLLRLRKGCTTVYAAHSLNELIGADKIFVLIRGKIVAEGVHEELLESCKWYRRVYKIQRAGRR